MSTRALLIAVVFLACVSAVVSSASLFLVLQQQNSTSDLQEQVTRLEKSVQSESQPLTNEAIREPSESRSQSSQSYQRLQDVVTRLEQHDSRLAEQVDRLTNHSQSPPTEQRRGSQ